MSAVATAWVWANSKQKGSPLLVLLAIADAANQQGENSYQSVATLASMARISESTTHRALACLLESGEVVEVGVHSQYGTKIYALSSTLKGGVNLTPPPEEGGVTGASGGVSPVTPEPRTNPTTPTTTSTSPQSTPSVREEVRGKMTKSWKPTIEASNEALSRFDSLPLSRVASEAQTFRDWHIAQDTPSKTRSQWDALWLTWLDRKNVEEAKESPPDEVKRDEVTGMPINPREPVYVPREEGRA